MTTGLLLKSSWILRALRTAIPLVQQIPLTKNHFSFLGLTLPISGGITVPKGLEDSHQAHSEEKAQRPIRGRLIERERERKSGVRNHVKKTQKKLGHVKRRTRDKIEMVIPMVRKKKKKKKRRLEWRREILGVVTKILQVKPARMAKWWEKAEDLHSFIHRIKLSRQPRTKGTKRRIPTHQESRPGSRESPQAA